MAPFRGHGDLQTLPVGLSTLQSRHLNEYGKLRAGTTLATIPVLVAYLVARRYLVQGLTLTGLKE